MTSFAIEGLPLPNDNTVITSRVGDAVDPKNPSHRIVDPADASPLGNADGRERFEPKRADLFVAPILP